MNTVEMTYLMEKVLARTNGEQLCLQVDPFQFLPVKKFMTVIETDGEPETVCVLASGMLYLCELPIEDFKLITITDVHEQVTH